MKNLDIEDLRCSYDWPEEDFFSETSLAPSVFGASVRFCRNRYSLPDSLKPLNNHLFTRLEAFRHDDHPLIGLANFYRADLGFAIRVHDRYLVIALQL